VTTSIDAAVPVPLTFNQERRLLVEELYRTVGLSLPPFHASMAFQLPDDCDEGAVEHALNIVVNRQKSLRASFFPTAGPNDAERNAHVGFCARTGLVFPGLYYQSIAPTAKVSLRRMSISEQEWSVEHGELAKAIDDEMAEPFDYFNPPMLRAVLLTTPSGNKILNLVMNHLVSDWWSLQVIRKELDNLYRRAMGFSTEAPPDLPMDYSTFAAWQRRAVHTEPLVSSLSYWRSVWQELERHQFGCDHLPFGRRPSEGSSAENGLATVDLGPELSHQLKAHATRISITPYMFLLGAVAIALRYLTGRSRLPLWGNFANRRLAGTNHLVGWFAHSHVLSMEIDDRYSGIEVLKHVRSVVLKAVQHEQVPLTFLWQSIGRVGEQPCGRIVFDLHTHSQAEGETEALFREMPIFRTTLPVQLELRAYLARNTVKIHSVYSKSRFESHSIDQLLQVIVSVVNALLERPDAPIRELHVGSRIRTSPSY
jgi:hypothetical protein